MNHYLPESLYVTCFKYHTLIPAFPPTFSTASRGDATVKKINCFIYTIQVVVDLAVPGATGVFAAPEGVFGEDRNRTDTLVLVSASPLAERRADAGGKLDGHTRVLAFEDDLRVVELAAEAEGNPFVCDATTVDLCAMAGGTIVQAHAQVREVCKGCWSIRKDW